MKRTSTTPGGPGIGSIQPAPVVKMISESPVATVMGFPSMFWTKLFAWKNDVDDWPAVGEKSGTLTRICCPAGKPSAFSPPP